MGFLGLDETQVRDDNMFQRMFWPSDHAGETDALGKQGFWVCWFVAVLSLLVLGSQGQWLIALLQLAFFGLGGIGVREHSVPAAVLVALAYWTNTIYGAIAGQFPGLIGIAAGVLLLANIRGTYIAARWAGSGDPDAMPERASDTVRDRFVDQMPMHFWPKGKFVFFLVAGMYMLLLTIGSVSLILHGPQTAHRVQNGPSQTLEVKPAP